MRLLFPTLLLPKNINDLHYFLFFKKSLIFVELQIASILLNESFFFDYVSNSLLFRKGNKLYLFVSILACLNVFEM